MLMLEILLSRVLPWFFVGLGYWFLYQLVRQNGQILLRLEALQRQVVQLKPSLATAPAPPAGLPAGSAAPEFALPDLAGTRRSLAEFRGRPLVVIFFNPGCGFCARMVPDLAALAAEADEGDGARGDRPLAVVITTGDVAANRRWVEEHQVRCPVLLQEKTEVAALYQARGTPSGYLIDAEGRIASDLTVGAPDLLGLVKDPASARRTDPTKRAAGGSCNGGGNGTSFSGNGKANKGLEASKLDRSGLKAGTPAPSFRLPGLDGGELALEDYRGRRVLLVFSDPECRPCMQLAPALERLHRNREDLAVLMVSRRDPEANRQKVAALGLTFPLGLQKSWEISRLYGIFATPVAYLIDEQGVIAADVALGVEPILALATPSLIGAAPVPTRSQTKPQRNGQAASARA
jgi:peroxiredoxin